MSLTAGTTHGSPRHVPLPPGALPEGGHGARLIALPLGPPGVMVGDVLIALQQTTTPEVLRRLV